MGGIDWPKFDGSQPCRQVDPDIFFPEKHNRNISARKAIEAAKAVCSTCKYQLDCLNYALSDSELKGIWAGTTEKDRALMRRRNRRLSVK
jgi:WhiB family redox-sensing transcriptional regulator